MSFPSFPVEIKCQIAGWVAALHRPSLYAFSLTNKACHAASVSLIFREINIEVDHPEGLRRRTEAMAQALSRTDSLNHIRRINIKGDLKLNAAKTKKETDQQPWWQKDGLDEILDQEEWRTYSNCHIVHTEPVIEQASTDDLAWTPVADLLKAIPHLKDLVYDCKNQFPPCLLATLHKSHPQCRLHHLTFQFQTLAWGQPDPYEIALATSPCLYRVRVACSSRDTEGEDDFHLEAAMELAAGVSPNLKEVEILSLDPILTNRYRRRREKWRGLSGFTGKTLGSLTALSIRGLSALHSPKMLQAWARHTDFSCLQHLTLGGSYACRRNGMTAETMKWVAQNHSFPNARKLEVYIQRDDEHRETPRFSEHAVSFFQAFAPLEELAVNGPLDAEILSAILARHGPALKKLRLNPFQKVYHNVVGARDVRTIAMEFTKERVMQIQAQCTALEELTLPINRDKSSAGEVELYRCFGRMHSLRSLFLILNCSSWRLGRDDTYDPQFHGQDDVVYPGQHQQFPLKRGHLKDIMINCAVNETLARSIWDTVGRHKVGKRLECLKLWTTGGREYVGGWESSHEDAIFKNLSRSWLIESHPRHDGEGIVKELGKRAREADGVRTRKRRDTEPNRIFEEIWPPKEGSESWQDDWSSFSLPG